ncbi:hypothetical protein [Bythopirellula polymerisocia]|uniref:hypothetical protein n=1 Tax=Bythopirellula polymerisocia TaxID=2528003 RepID=UPI0011B3A552|nr:hypothetical protein [Bythopirellula polymerisocia]
MIACTVMLLASGCAGPWHARQDVRSSAVAHDEVAPPKVATASPSQESAALRIDPYTSLAKHETPADPAQETALNIFLSEVRSNIALDATAEAQLRKELLQSRQDEWPMVLRQFRSALNYRQELLAREARQLTVPPDSHSRSISPITHDPITHQTTLNPATMQLEQLRTELAQERQTQFANHQRPVQPQVAEPSASLPIQNAILANHTTALPNTQQSSAIEPAGHTTAVKPAQLAWQDHLTDAITAMQQEVKPLPGSTDELQEHMRLRMLLLTAGREEDSLEPIPGASASEQDYWSKQLFAISALLDSERQPDMKQRAAGALVHLDQARARLGELASLQVRNLTFADSVDGYGLYEPHADTRFKPGDQVTLYTEVENFRSESTKKGFRTSLATSYEVVDPHGRHVEGAQFPEVEDICQNLRHDFHMQYGLALPTRIYPGSYELRLTITDQLSNKIGHSTIPFEIIE